MRRLLRALFVGLAALVVLWFAGFAWFLRLADRAPPPPRHADAIVALTGGAGRVETALRLLAEGRARIALVSGVGGAAEFAALARRAEVDPALGARVTLGRAARTTRGNAAETAGWAKANDVHSLIVVTAFYHMPRALAELSRAMPAIALHPVPVPVSAPWRLLLGEYAKFLAAELGVSDLSLHGALRAEHGG